MYDATCVFISVEVAGVNYKHSDKYCKAFGNHLRKVRQEKGLSMRKLAIQADMEYSQLSKIERGTINTTISTVYALAEALDINHSELFMFDFPIKNK